MAKIDYFGTQKASYNGFLDFCRKNVPLLVAVTIALVFTYGGKLVWYSIGVDSVVFLADKPKFLQVLIQQGRWGTPFLHLFLWIKDFNPFTAFFVTFCHIELFTLSWCYIISVFSKNTGRNNNLIPFALLFMTMPVWAETFYFVLYSAEVSLTVLLCPYVIYLLFKGFLDNEKWKIILGVILLVFMISIYEAFIPMFICGVFVCFILLQENSNYKPRVYNLLCLKLAIALLVAVVIYALLTKIILFLMHLENANYQGYMNWSEKESIKGNIILLLRYGYAITIGHLSAVQAVVEPFMANFYPVKGLSKGSLNLGNILLLPAAVCFIIQIARLAQKKIPTGRRLLFILAGIGIPFSIMLFPIISPNAFVPRSMYVLPFATAIMLFFLIEKAKKVATIITCCALIVAVRQAQISAQLFHTAHICYQNDVHLAHELDRRIQAQADTAGLPIAIIVPPFTHSVFKTDLIQGEVIGFSNFEWNYGLPLMKTLGMNYTAPNKAQMEEARKVAETMPSYPAQGCIKCLPDVIVVKLADCPQGKLAF